MPAEDAQAAAELWREHLGDEIAVLVTSSATGEGLDALAAELLHRVPIVAPVAQAPAALDEPLAEHKVFRPAAGRGFDVQRLDDGVFRVEGDGIVRLLARHDLDNDEALAHVEGRLRRMGVINALEAAGFEPGDDVEIAGVLFELHPGDGPAHLRGACRVDAQRGSDGGDAVRACGSPTSGRCAVDTHGRDGYVAPR